VEIILAGEVPDKDLFMEEETSPLEVKKSIKKELPVAVSKEPELLISDSTEDEEEIVFNCETGNDVQEE
jgi:hypothetical protein